MTPRLVLLPRKARPFFGRHPWVFAGAVARAEGEPEDGGEIDLVSHEGEFIARGLHNSQSKIVARLYSWEQGEAIDEAFLARKIRAAVRLREALGLMDPAGACRLVNSEGDGLSGLTVDRYGKWLAVQFTALGMGMRRGLAAKILGDLLSPEGIYLRTEKGIGELEGLEARDGPLTGGDPPPLEIEEGGLSLAVNLAQGHKTGYYLDQRENRAAVAALAQGRRVLDGFCYSGGFALQALKAGAAEAVGVDSSEPALALARANAERNGLAERSSFVRADVFNDLEERAGNGERFGVVVLDPPKMARSRGGIEDALRGYRRLMSLGLRLVEEDGFLAMCCCSGRIT
ncbi:MAG: class I SAM-dependent rRNA methyltransferase, partial [Gemmataceae bacterium]|nr:class I SAM-dependent rRNA methyltransferase [Gemmataceae bacterium]